MAEVIIAIDFDGTVVTHEYPRIGKDIGAVPYLKRLTDNGHKLILFTMRSGNELEEAKKWFAERNIPLYGINENPDQNWTTSPKPYAHLYIDDSGLGVPLKKEQGVSKTFVDWDKVALYLKAYNLI